MTDLCAARPTPHSSYGSSSGTVGVISLAKAVIRGTPSPEREQYTRAR